jgi:hypothetical protein
LFVLFHFLHSQFLGYLIEWKQQVTEKAQKEGLTAAQRNKMFLSHQTYEGIVMTGMLLMIISL